MDLSLFWQNHKNKIFSFFVAVYCFPQYFSKVPLYSYDGGWMTSLNLAVRDNLVFGRDFIFTYGPLGILSTRYTLYINDWLLISADLLFFTGCFHFLYRYVLTNKGLGIIAFLAMLLFRTTAFSQSLFVIFIIYAALSLLNSFRSNFEIVYCALSGVLLFFIKINYGMLAITGLLLFVVLIAILNPRKLLIFLVPAVMLFTLICLTTYIDVPGYFRYSLEVMTQYDEAGYWPAKRREMIFLSGICLEVSVVVIFGCFVYTRIKGKKMDIPAILFLCCLAAVCVVLYRNAYTRADHYHYGEYFATMPFLILAIVVMCGFQEAVISKLLVLAVIATAWYNLIRADIADGSFMPNLQSGYYTSYFSPIQYVKGVFIKNEDKNEDKKEAVRLLDDYTTGYIGNKTVDIIPWETQLLHFYNFNYHPRPLPQTCGYAGVFDSINADFFAASKRRPELVMIQNFPIDYKYFFWEEPMTKTSLQLNYRYDTFVRVNKWAGVLKDGYFDTYLMLSPRGDSQVYPHYEKIGIRSAKLGENVILDFPGDEAIYMVVKFNYTAQGKLRRMLYQPPNMHVFFHYDDGNAGAYRVSVSSLKQPVLVNKVMQNQEEMRYFFAGNLVKCRNMKAFYFQPVTAGFEKEYTIEFMRLKNYRAEY